MSETPAPTIKRRRLRQLLRKMVNIYSPSGKEGDLVDFVEGYLKRHGLPACRQKVDESRDNVVIEPDDAEPDLFLVGHLDTVEAYDLDTFAFQQDGDTCYGLGTADMKGGCAAMIEAILTLWETGHRDLPIGVALVVGEEESGDGARRLTREHQFSAAIVGEPTGLEPCLGHYGYMEVQLVTKGRRMHASMAGGGSAITSMLHLLLRFTHHLDTAMASAAYNIRDLSSSEAGFAVPERCEAWLDLHLPPHTATGEVTFELEEVVEAQQTEDPSLDAEIHFHTIDGGYELPPKGPLVEALRTVYARHGFPFEPQSFRSHSDANQLWNAGVRPVLLGPGRLAKAHSPDESVSFDEVARAAQMYVDVALALGRAD